LNAAKLIFILQLSPEDTNEYLQILKLTCSSNMIQQALFCQLTLHFDQFGQHPVFRSSQR
jgi:hypothetical protein